MRKRLVVLGASVLMAFAMAGMAYGGRMEGRRSRMVVSE